MKIKNKRKENKMKKILQKIVYYIIFENLSFLLLKKYCLFRNNIVYYNKIQKEDCKLSFFYRNCFELFSPLFYHTHTQEEINRISKEELKKLEECLQQYKNSILNQ